MKFNPKLWKTALLICLHILFVCFWDGETWPLLGRGKQEINVWQGLGKDGEGVGRKVLVCFWALATGNIASTGYKQVLKCHLYSLSFSPSPCFMACLEPAFSVQLTAWQAVSASCKAAGDQREQPSGSWTFQPWDGSREEAQGMCSRLLAWGWAFWVIAG